ncbi:hypothetical protein C8R46DRAFT_134901 [Mycena filopes]|nr:hypothetical protein C8R46DRAFT_134901 [Mycena filopes]
MGCRWDHAVAVLSVAGSDLWLLEIAPRFPTARGRGHASVCWRRHHRRGCYILGFPLGLVQFAVALRSAGSAAASSSSRETKKEKVLTTKFSLLIIRPPFTRPSSPSSASCASASSTRTSSAFTGPPILPSSTRPSSASPPPLRVPPRPRLGHRERLPSTRTSSAFPCLSASSTLLKSASYPVDS